MLGILGGSPRIRQRLESGVSIGHDAFTRRRRTLVGTVTDVSAQAVNGSIDGLT